MQVVDSSILLFQGDALECPLCLSVFPATALERLAWCSHRCCEPCLRQYLAIEIFEARVPVNCPVCHESMHPSGKTALSLFKSLLFYSCNNFQNLQISHFLITSNQPSWSSSKVVVISYVFTCLIAVSMEQNLSIPLLKLPVYKFYIILYYLFVPLPICGTAIVLVLSSPR